MFIVVYYAREVIKISIFLVSGFYAFYKISIATNPDEHVSILVVFVSEIEIKKSNFNAWETKLVEVSFRKFFLRF